MRSGSSIMSALYETAEEVQETIIDAFDQATGRGDFLRTVIAAGAGVAAIGVGGGLLSAGRVDAASLGLDTRLNKAGIPQSDIDILNYALTLEHIEATFYAGVKRTDAPTGQILHYVHIIAAHEKAHVDALTAAISQNGGKPVAAKMYKFPKISLPFGITVENLGVNAYLGALPMIKTAALVPVAASIVTVEARHAAAWATLNYGNMPNGLDFTKGAFDTGLDMATVVKAVTPFFA